LAFNDWNYMGTHGLEEESTYPYTGVQGTCKYNSSKGKVGTDPSNTYKQIKGGSKASWASSDNMMAAITIKPTEVSINASSIAFKTYSNGVITTGCAT